MYLIFDTETNGLPRFFNSPMEDLTNWPRITQFAFLLIDENGNELEKFQSLIKPDNWTIPKDKFFIENNMTTERCNEFGIPIFNALRKFQDALKKCKYKVAHNIAFDKNVVGAEIIRAGITLELFKFTPEICTMKSSTNHVCIRNQFGGYKWPKLIELHNFLFGCDFEGAHDAMDDVQATAKCLIELINRGIIKLK
jgi:DNA polymerase III epsilon subunit-like protein